MTVTYSGVDDATLVILARELTKSGAKVTWADGYSGGRVESIAGVLTFACTLDGVLTIELIEDACHFPKQLLIGGMRQMVEEAKESAAAERRREQEAKLKRMQKQKPGRKQPLATGG
jgi:hypothetical protein